MKYSIGLEFRDCYNKKMYCIVKYALDAYLCEQVIEPNGCNTIMLTRSYSQEYIDRCIALDNSKRL